MMHVTKNQIYTYKSDDSIRYIVTSDQIDTLSSIGSDRAV